MKKTEFEKILDECCEILTAEAQEKGFKEPKEFENRVREVLARISPFEIDFDSQRLEDSESEIHTTEQARLYTSLSQKEKDRYRAEAALLCPEIVKSGRSRNKYDKMVVFLLTYYGIICHQARDLFSAGSVANPENDDDGGNYIERALKLLEHDMEIAAQSLSDRLFEEYWGESCAPEKRIDRWLEKADSLAKDWKPSESLFFNREFIGTNKNEK